MNGPAYWGQLNPNYIACSLGKNQSPIDIKESIASFELRPLRFQYPKTIVTLRNTTNTLRGRFEVGSYIILDKMRFRLDEISFHIPSEHRLKGSGFDMEVHLLHSNEKGQKVILAIFANEGSYNKGLAKMFRYLKRPINKEIKLIGFTAKHLLPERKNYLRYSGSLTVPPCTEGVSWIVMANPISVSARQLDRFEARFGSNSRPIQDAFSRIPLRSR